MRGRSYLKFIALQHVLHLAQRSFSVYLNNHIRIRRAPGCPVSHRTPNCHSNCILGITGEDAVETLDDFIKKATSANGTRAASAQRLERQGRALTYSLNGAISTSEVFAMAEQGRKVCNVEEYGESRATARSMLRQYIDTISSVQPNHFPDASHCLKNCAARLRTIADL